MAMANDPIVISTPLTMNRVLTSDAPSRRPGFYHFPLPKEAQAWCDANGYVEPFQNEGQWWAFKGAAVMPVRITELIRV